MQDHKVHEGLGGIGVLGNGLGPREHLFDDTSNLASNPEFIGKLEEMKKLLVQELKRFPDRPFGEFIPGGNATPAGSYDDVLETMRNFMSQFDGDMKKQSQSKKKNQMKKPAAPSGNASKKAERQARKAKRGKK